VEQVLFAEVMDAPVCEKGEQAQLSGRHGRLRGSGQRGPVGGRQGVGLPADDRHDGLGIRSLLELAQETAYEGTVEER